MRERPLSITIIAWLNAAAFSVIIALMLFSHDEFIAGTTWMSTEMEQAFYITSYTVGLLGSMMILRAKKWARWCLVIACVFDSMSLLISETSGTNLLNPVFMTVVLWYLFRPRSNAFFNDSDNIPPWTHQAGTAACYISVGFFLMLSLVSIAGWGPGGGFDTYAVVLFGVIPAMIFGVGNALGLVLRPKRDVGFIFVATSALSLTILVVLFLDEEEAAQMLSIWISVAMNISLFAIGVVLEYRAKLEEQLPLSVPPYEAIDSP